MVRLNLTRNGAVTVVVADGMGGHAGGAVASRLAVEMILASPVPLVGDTVAGVLDEVNVALAAQGMRDRSLEGAGCTIAGVTFEQDRAWVFNIGDSRVYRVAEGMVGQLSVDDRPPRMPGQPPDVRSSVLTQCLGGTSEPRPLRPHLRCEILRPGDGFLLCSDGLSDYVSAEQISEATRADDDADVALALLDRALTAGAPDNVTVVLARALVTEPG
jgi:serine/threonine protein phosphatase PrpC